MQEWSPFIRWAHTTVGMHPHTLTHNDGDISGTPITPLTCTRSPTPSKGPPACTSSAHKPIVTPDHSRSVSPTHIASHTHGHMHPTWTHPPPTRARRACSHLPCPPPHTHPPPWRSHTPLAGTRVHTHALQAHASPAPMLRASSMFPKAEDWPYGVLRADGS